MEESSQAVDPDGFYSTTSGTYEEAQPVVVRYIPSAHTVSTGTTTAPEDVFSTPSDVYEEAQVVYYPSKVPTNKTITLRTETAVVPQDVYSTRSGVYEDANPVQAVDVPAGKTITLRTQTTATALENVYSTSSGIYEEGEPVQQRNLLSGQTVKTETAAASQDVYSTPSGIYEEAQPVQPSNIPTNQKITLRTETVAAREDVYSTPSDVYEEPELVVMRDVVPGQAVRGGTSVTGQNRNMGQAADRTGSSAKEEPARRDRIRPFLSNRKGVCFVITACVNFAVAAMLFGIFIGKTTETRHFDPPYPVTLQGYIQKLQAKKVADKASHLAGEVQD
uniref:Uncharacterized protein n=1 Tax=Branchiostoma floridae TaxID=7739 RepID=C3ZG51_BRAFL|eukprot:XP_002592515.1 hypothetical protein BRAFLDRAFT_69006 [Branchiostoma floridae]